MQELGKLLREKSTSRMAAYRNLDFGVHSTNEEGNHEKAGSVAMRHAKLLDRQPVPVRSDVLLHGLSPFTLKSLRRAIEQGLMPSGLDFTGDDDSSVIIRFTQPRAGEARLMVGVEFYPEDNEIVGKVYDAESRLKYAAEPRDAHLAGSVRATVSRLLRELASKIAGDPSF
jgi:hypothetical protein